MLSLSNYVSYSTFYMIFFLGYLLFHVWLYRSSHSRPLRGGAWTCLLGLLPSLEAFSPGQLEVAPDTTQTTSPHNYTVAGVVDVPSTTAAVSTTPSLATSETERTRGVDTLK